MYYPRHAVVMLFVSFPILLHDDVRRGTSQEHLRMSSLWLKNCRSKTQFIHKSHQHFTFNHYPSKYNIRSSNLISVECIKLNQISFSSEKILDFCISILQCIGAVAVSVTLYVCYLQAGKWKYSSKMHIGFENDDPEGKFSQLNCVSRRRCE